MCTLKQDNIISHKECNINSNRSELLKLVRDSHNNLFDTIRKFNNDLKEKKPINKEDLEAFPLFVWVQLNENVKIRKRRMLFGDHLNFDTIMKKGGEFGKHFHDDLIESCEIIDGEVIDLEDGKVYRDDDVMHYEKGQQHTPVANKDSVLKVIFKP